MKGYLAGRDKDGILRKQETMKRIKFIGTGQLFSFYYIKTHNYVKEGFKQIIRNG
jgi:hypothetical protein